MAREVQKEMSLEERMYRFRFLDVRLSPQEKDAVERVISAVDAFADKYFREFDGAKLAELRAEGYYVREK